MILENVVMVEICNNPGREHHTQDEKTHRVTFYQFIVSVSVVTYIHLLKGMHAGKKSDLVVVFYYA